MTLRIRYRELVECTGVSASWCPNHGDCICPRDSDGQPVEVPGEVDPRRWWVQGMNRIEHPECPLHSMRSDHG